MTLTSCDSALRTIDAAAAESTGSMTMALTPCASTELACCCCLAASAPAFWYSTVQPGQSCFILALNSGASYSSYRVEEMSGIKNAIFACLPSPELFDEQAAAVSARRAAAPMAAGLGRSLFAFSSDEGTRRHGGHRITTG